MRLLLLIALPLTTLAGAGATTPAPWVPDRGDGTYQNPVLFADYSDPDAVRVGSDFYLTASSFPATPGLPILHSKDLVNWTIINHVFAAQPPAGYFSKPRHGQGVWAPAIRHHGGKFWMFYPDPDFGIYVTTATDPASEWSAPFLLEAGKGLIDPCPCWDDDGTFYLIHGWAKSRAGIANLRTLHPLSADGTIIIDANKLPGPSPSRRPRMNSMRRNLGCSGNGTPTRKLTGPHSPRSPVRSASPASPPPVQPRPATPTSTGSASLHQGNNLSVP